jgi:ABC-type molybdate transport system substrate-binding protein
LSPAESQKVTASSLISTLTGLVSGAKKEKEKAPLELSLTQCQQLTVAAAQGLSDFTNEQAAACNKYNPR